MIHGKDSSVKKGIHKLITQVITSYHVSVNTDIKFIQHSLKITRSFKYKNTIIFKQCDEHTITGKLTKYIDNAFIVSIDKDIV